MLVGIQLLWVREGGICYSSEQKHFLKSSAGRFYNVSLLDSEMLAIRAEFVIF